MSNEAPSRVAVALAQSQRAIRGRPCSVGLSLNCLEQDDRRDFYAAMEATDNRGQRLYTDAQLVHLLAETFDIRLSRQQFGHHRRGDCSCPE